LTDEGPHRRERIEGHPKWLYYLLSTRVVGAADTAGGARA